MISCFTGFVIWVCYNSYQFNLAADQEQVLLKARNNVLEHDLAAAEKNLKETEHKLTGANQEIEQITIRYMADELYITELERRYTNIYLYALTAQEILVAQGIEFRMVEGGLDYKALSGEEK